MHRDLEKIVAHVKKILVGREFKGEYIERSNVPILETYREVVVVDSAEAELSAHLTAALEVLKLYPSVRWPSITVHDSNEVRLWVCFATDKQQVPFGVATWAVSSVAVHQGELLLIANRVSAARALSPQAFDLWDHIDLAAILAGAKEMARMTAIIFLFTLDMARQMFVISAQLVWKFLDALPHTIDALTPIAVTMVHALTQCVAGLYMLIALLWTGRPPNREPGPYPPVRAIQPRRQHVQNGARYQVEYQDIDQRGW